MIGKQRLRDYPRLVFTGTWIVLLVKTILHHGWLDGLRKLIGVDFIVHYAGGLLYRQDITHLYNFTAQVTTQQELIQPTILPGTGFYSTAPYVALAYSLFTYIPLTWALAIWSVLTLLSVVLAAHLIVRYLAPAWLVNAGLSRAYLSIIVFSSLIFVLGFHGGQNHGLTLLLFTGICITTLAERWYTSGVLAGCLLYKPQFTLGFLVLWLVWKKPRALAGFVCVATVWAGAAVLLRGLDPFWAYLDVGKQVLLLPYTEGYPGYLLVTPYGFLTSLLPLQSVRLLVSFTWLLMFAVGVWLAWVGHRFRHHPEQVLALAVLFPLVATPYTMAYDLVILVPFFILLAYSEANRTNMLYAAIATYFATLFLPLLGRLSSIAFIAAVPFGLFLMQSKVLLDTMGSSRQRSWSLEEELIWLLDGK